MQTYSNCLNNTFFYLHKHHFNDFAFKLTGTNGICNNILRHFIKITELTQSNNYLLKHFSI